MPSVNFIEAQLSRAAVASCAECLILMVIDGHVTAVDQCAFAHFCKNVHVLWIQQHAQLYKANHH
jgi:hypothetical protein